MKGLEEDYEAATAGSMAVLKAVRLGNFDGAARLHRALESLTVALAAAEAAGGLNDTEMSARARMVSAIQEVESELQVIARGWRLNALGSLPTNLPAC